MRFSLPPTRIATRLSFGFGGVMLLVAGIGLFASRAGDISSATFAGAMRAESGEALDQRIEKRIADARSFLWKYLATGDEAAFARSREAVGFARDRLKELSARTVAERRPEVVALTETLESYAASMGRLEEAKASNAGLGTPATCGAAFPASTAMTRSATWPRRCSCSRTMRSAWRR